ncbi:MAG: hypothetical protein HC828_06745 [Blastochloris sp.]|nr:hypothetical protein [Blastochloris sp.]
MSTPHVFVYGKSLFIAGIAAQLRAVSGLVVQQIHTAAVPAGCAAVIVCDLADVRADRVLEWLCDCPHVQVIGLDLQRRRAIVFTTTTQPVSGASDLHELIRRALPEGMM